jgi:HSP20 family molecular chaperone IbpA
MSTQEKEVTDVAVPEAEEQNVRSVKRVRYRPEADVYQSKDAVRILLDLPGASESDPVVELHDGVLSVSAEVSRGEEEIRTYERSFRLDRRLNVDAVEASIDLGVLQLRIPYSEEAKPRRIEVTRA